MNTAPPPPRELMAAIQYLRMGDNIRALSAAETALKTASDRLPPLALASLAALRGGEPDRAIPYLRELIERKPDDAASRINLANALVETGQLDEALEFVDGSDLPALARIEGFIAQQRGDLTRAAASYQRALTADDSDLASFNNLANVLWKLGRIDASIHAFEKAIGLAPADVQIYRNLAEVLRDSERYSAWLKVLQDAERIVPDDLDVLIDLSLAYGVMDDLDTAVAKLRHAIAVHPQFGAAHIELGLMLETLNRTDELKELIDSMDRDRAPPEAAFLDSWLARREDRFQDAADLAESIPETIMPSRRYALIGGIADRLDDTQKAFAAFEKMNAATRAAAPVSRQTYRQKVEAENALLTDRLAADWTSRETTDAHRDPVFLVGFPRSGTTLLDTMLMGLPELSVLEERPMVHKLHELVRDDEDLATMPAERVTELRARYFDFAREEGWDAARWLVDKHPLNMQRVPLLHRLFPQARFILAERHPMDVVLSCFMANFRPNFAMRSFTDLEEAARTYDAVFTSWKRATDLLPVDWKPVRYESLVTDPAAELAPVIEWLGLEWNDRLLDHTATARERGRVKTASYSQIQENLYSRASGRWRRYEKQLEPVRPILEPWIETLGYADAG